MLFLNKYLYKVLIASFFMRWGVIILLGVFFVSFASAVVSDDTCDSSMIAYWQMDECGSCHPYQTTTNGKVYKVRCC